MFNQIAFSFHSSCCLSAEHDTHNFHLCTYRLLHKVAGREKTPSLKSIPIPIHFIHSPFLSKLTRCMCAAQTMKLGTYLFMRILFSRNGYRFVFFTLCYDCYKIYIVHIKNTSLSSKRKKPLYFLIVIFSPYALLHFPESNRCVDSLEKGKSQCLKRSIYQFALVAKK